ncbi:Hsp20/alpha crystallin family protein [Patescibacteria group bacterium]|nr:Hsp20/alpha crystallin family protein [Patescibacteria group bacterium]
MDQEAKKFFEGIADSSEETEIEPNVELAKAAPVADAPKHEHAPKEEKKEASIADLMDEGEGQLTIDVYQTPNDIVVESTIAGVEPDNLDVDISPEAVTIRGKREKVKKIAEEDYFYQECYWGKFSRSVILPQEIDPEKSIASLKNGVLMIKMPKVDRQRSKKLKVSLN